MALTVGSLFAGIGGFDLGFERAGFEIRWQVEIDPFCRAVLEKHWPGVQRFEDVRTVTGCEWLGGHYLQPVDVIVGGFPCQDISATGLGAGIDGERSGLWREFDRLVGELRPRYVVVENSPALTVRGLGRVLGNLAARGFDAEWTTLSACAFGAPHMRRRMLIVAHTNGVECAIRLRDLFQRAGTLQVIDDFPRERASHGARMEGPSALYGGIDGIPDRMDRNHAIGNAVFPAITEWIARRIQEAEESVNHDLF